MGLFCLDKTGSIPVDTHVWQIAARDYMPKLKQAKSLTDKLYDEIGDYFRDLWGPYAGWAHSVSISLIKVFSCSTQLSMKFILLINVNIVGMFWNFKIYLQNKCLGLKLIV